MIDYVNSELFTTDSINKQLKLTFSDGSVITNEDIYSESMEITESLCSEQTLRYGCCEASIFKITLANTFVSKAGLTVTVDMVLNHDTANPFRVGTYKVVSDTPSGDRRKRELTCYDAMYDILNSDVIAWYNTIFPSDNSTTTMANFRTSFLAYFGLTSTDTLCNDAMTISKTISSASLSGKDVITAICEANGVFGHIGRDGSFKFVQLSQIILGLYPSDDLYPADDLYPKEDSGVTNITNSTYITAEYSDYTTELISKLTVRDSSEVVGVSVGSGTNEYVMEGNFLLYGKSSTELSTIATNIFNIIKWHWYRPFECDLKGNPCFEVGDGVRIVTTYEIIMGYILQRTLKGIQALRDTFIADGTQKQSEVATSLTSEIKQLKGVTHTITNTVDTLDSRITDVNTGLSSSITQLAGAVSAKVDNTNTNQSFGWTLTSSEWKLHDQNGDVFKVNSSGATLNGKFHANDSTNGQYTDIDGGVKTNYCLVSDYGSTSSHMSSLLSPLMVASVDMSSGAQSKMTPTKIYTPSIQINGHDMALQTITIDGQQLTVLVAIN